jgi:methylated-DNA-[protein]-cysteine S-methyltransferase
LQVASATQYLESPIGLLKITASQKGIASVIFQDDKTENETPSFLTNQCVIQLSEYYLGKRKKFELPLYPEGTPFQQRVWEQLLNIPYAKTISYRQLAVSLGDTKCIRAAGTANGKNPIAVIIPCHRIIGSHGELIGYAGGLARKKWLLNHEAKVNGTFAQLF